jgi:hypothetical protein
VIRWLLRPIDNLDLVMAIVLLSVALVEWWVFSGELLMDIVEQLIVMRDSKRFGFSRSDRELLAEACNEIVFLRREIERLKA